jgi:polar amino acid transport system substrate-binding protein
LKPANRLTLWFLLSASNLFGSASAGERVVLETDDEYPPYSYMQDGQFKGIYVDLIKHAAKLLAPEYDVVISPIPWKRGMKNLESGQSLGLVGTYRNQDRLYISQYSVPLNHEVLAIFCGEHVMDRSPRKFPADFAGLTIGINLGFVLGERVTAAINSQLFRIRESKGNQANLLKLQSGEIDCYINDRLAVYHSFNLLRASQRHNRLHRFDNFRLNEAQILANEEVLIGYSQSNSAEHKQDFINKMNLAIEQLNKKHLIDDLIGRSIEANNR